MSDAHVDASWERTLATLRHDTTVSQRVFALLMLSRPLGVVADTALVARPAAPASELFDHRIAASLTSAVSEATGRESRFAVTVDESLMLDDEDEDPQPSSGVTSSVTQRDAHDVDSDVDRSGHDVPTVHNDPPFRRGESSMLPECPDSGPP